MKNKLKIISVFAVILAIMMSLTSSCFADTLYNEDLSCDIYYNNQKYKLSFASSYSIDVPTDGYKNYIIYKNSDMVWVYCTGEDEFYVSSSYKPNKLYEPSTNYDIVRFLYSSSSDSFNMSSFGHGGSGRVDFDEILFSSYDVKNTYDNSIFFEQTPAVQTLAMMAQEMPLEATQVEILGILPLIIAVVVSLVGLRKALTWLSARLRQS